MWCVHVFLYPPLFTEFFYITMLRSSFHLKCCSWYFHWTWHRKRLSDTQANRIMSRKIHAAPCSEPVLFPPSQHQVLLSHNIANKLIYRFEVSRVKILFSALSVYVFFSFRYALQIPRSFKNESLYYPLSLSRSPAVRRTTSVLVWWVSHRCRLT